MTLVIRWTQPARPSSSTRQRTPWKESELELPGRGVIRLRGWTDGPGPYRWQILVGAEKLDVTLTATDGRQVRYEGKSWVWARKLAVLDVVRWARAQADAMRAKAAELEALAKALP